jgi:phosphomannomutase
VPARSGEEGVRFGTDGWRGIIARDFTFDNVARAAQGIADFLRSPDRPSDPIYTEWGTDCRDGSHGVVIGYDTRFLSEAFALHCAAVLQQDGIPVVVSDPFAPTPAVSYAVVERKAAMGVVITSSHNPPEYNGLKIKAEYGGSAPASITEQVERRLPDQAPSIVASQIDRVDLVTPYMARIEELIDRDRLTASPIHVVIDSMYGSAQGLVARFLQSSNIPYTQIRGTVDVMFGGRSPEPLEKNLGPLRDAMIAARSAGPRTIGVVTDGDGDRVSAMDENGEFIDAHRTYALILRYLVEERGWRDPIVVSFNLSDLIRRMAAAYGLEVIEIPIGFKHAAEHIVKRNILIAGEESGSYAIRGHIPERDGVFLSLLLAEILATSDKTASELARSLHDEFGPQSYARRDLHVEARLQVVADLKAAPPGTFAGRSVRSVETLDGIKLRFEDGWLLFRASGTEPILRVYCEMTTEKDVQQVLDAAERLARGD